MDKHILINAQLQKILLGKCVFDNLDHLLHWPAGASYSVKERDFTLVSNFQILIPKERKIILIYQ